MPINTTAGECSDDYCDQLEEMLFLKMQALKIEYQPSAKQWIEAVKKMNILAENFLVERHDCRYMENEILNIREAIAGRKNAVHDEARQFLGWYGVKHVFGDVDPLGLYLQGPLKKAQREFEKSAVARDDAEEALWEAINALPAIWKQEREDSTADEGDRPGVVVLSVMAAPEPVDIEGCEELADVPEAVTTTPCPLATQVTVVVVGSVDADDGSAEISSALRALAQ